MRPDGSAPVDGEATTQVLPEIDPESLVGKTFLMSREVDGTVVRAEVTKRLEAQDGETDLHLVRLGDETVTDVMAYDAVVRKVHEQLEQGDDGYWSFKKVVDHRKTTNGVREIRMKWEDDSDIQERLSIVRTDDLVYLAKYATENGLANTPDGTVEEVR